MGLEVYLGGYMERYPESRVCDVYKLLYQAFHGSEHLVPDTDTVSYWLDREWEEINLIDYISDIPLTEPIFIDGTTPELYRLNLRPAKANDVDKNLILDEFLRASVGFLPSDDEKSKFHQKFIAAWEEARALVSKGILKLDPSDYDEYSGLARGNGWIQASHSKEYKAKYKPHYRLILDQRIFQKSGT